MILRNLLKKIHKEETIELVILNEAPANNHYLFDNEKGLPIDLKDLEDYVVKNAYTEYDRQLGNTKIVIEIQIPYDEQDLMDTYFYGIDFKKVRVYCKVKTTSYIKLRNEFREVSKVLLNIDTDKFYLVEYFNFIDEKLKITVNCTRLKYDETDYSYSKNSEDRFKLVLSFDDVEFSYFFEDTLEDELEKNIF